MVATKDLYRLALEQRADIIIMITLISVQSKLIPAMVSIIGNGLHPCVWAAAFSEVTLEGGHAPWKIWANRLLTLAEELC